MKEHPNRLGAYALNVEPECPAIDHRHQMAEQPHSLVVVSGSTQGASDVFRGGIVSYASEVKYSLLGVPEGPVLSADAAKAMAEGARRVLGADVALATTGVAGPAEQEGQPVGTVFLGVSMDDGDEAVRVTLPGNRNLVRRFATTSLLNMLRLRLE